MAMISRGAYACFLAILMKTLVSAHAAELPEFYRGIRAMAMGNAFTAISDDADAVFYNPAGLVFNRRIEFDLLNPKLDFSGDDLTSVSLIRDASSSLNSSKLGKFFGKHIYANGLVFPSVYFPGFVLGYYYGGQAGFVARNMTLPQIEATVLYDRGLVTGAGFETKGWGRDHFLRFGFTLKWLTRTGFDGTIPFSRLVTADSDYFKDLMAGPSMGWGFGTGFQYEIPFTKADEIVLGSSWQDIGDTRFGSSLQSGSRPPSIKNNLATGLALAHHFGRLGRLGGDSALTLSGEVRNWLIPDVDPLLKLHFGMEIKLSDLSLQAGLNGDSLTGGIALDMGLFKVAAVTYGVETQSLAFQDRERRYMAQFTFKLDMGGQTFKRERDIERRKHPRQ